MLDAKKFTYEPFLNDSRPVSLQSSGKKLLATDENGNRYVVKHIYMHNAANEYVGCWLAGKLNVPAPKAYLMSIDHRLKSPYGVAIEYLDGLTCCPKDLSPYFEDIASIYAFNHLISQYDKVQMSFYNGHVVTYDFSEAFEVAEWSTTTAFYPEIIGFMMQNIELRKARFEKCISMNECKDDIADSYHLDKTKFRKAWFATEKRALDITDTEIKNLENELAQMYPPQIAEFYGDCIRIIREHVRAKFS